MNPQRESCGLPPRAARSAGAIAVGAAILAVAGLSAQVDEKFDAAIIRPAAKDLPLITRFDINPGYLRARSASLKFMITEAFGISDQQLLGGSGWMDSELFMVEASAGSAVTQPEMMRMLRNLLTTRFKLAYHHEQREFNVFALVTDKGGSKLEPLSEPMDFHGQGKSTRDTVTVPIGSTIQDLVRWLNTRTGRAAIGRLVVDRTELHGLYRIRLTMETVPKGDGSGGMFLNIDYPSELPRQLGLRLLPTKAMIDTIVIDNADRPTFDE